MVSVTEAKDLIHKNTAALPPVSTRLSKALALVLAEDVFAKASVPPFHQSGMDGYAFRYKDFLQTKALRIAGEVAAGDGSEQGFFPHQAVRIFTGAPIPAWADTVVMQEKTETAGDNLLINDETLIEGSNVRSEGLEIRKHELAVKKGTVLTPAAIGFLAGAGIRDVNVYPNPAIHIIVTGNELQEAGKPLEAGQVYESNSVMLQSALAQLHINDVSVSKVGDDLHALRDALNDALKNANLVLLTGGVSVGKYDFVVQAASACGVTPIFHKVAQRPGKPLFFGTKEGKTVFGLPGNPASVLTCFYVYVTAALEAMTGRQNLLPKKQLPLSVAISKKIQLTQFMKAMCDEKEVTPLPAQESFRLGSFALANCLIVLPPDRLEFAEGERVETLLLPYL